MRTHKTDWATQLKGKRRGFARHRPNIKRVTIVKSKRYGGGESSLWGRDQRTGAKTLINQEGVENMWKESS